MATSLATLKAPPAFNDSEDDYISWKNDITVWKMYTDILPAKQGPAVYLCLKGQAREAVRELSIAELGADNGLDNIIEKLDTLFLKDKDTRAYLAFKEFYIYKRTSGETCSEFIIKYEKLYY